jgi:hypothetical protein
MVCPDSDRLGLARLVHVLLTSSARNIPDQVATS